MFKKWIIASTLFAGLTGAGIAQEAPPFGDAADLKFANELWQQLAAARMVGPDAITATVYQGAPPHAETLATQQAIITVNGSDGLAIVKKNFGQPDQEAPTQDEVFADPEKHLRVHAVMYQREAGYDSENKDWFWAMFAPNGNVVVNPLGLTMAGKIASLGKGLDDAPFNCIVCHSGAPGDDYVFIHDAVPAR